MSWVLVHKTRKGTMRWEKVSLNGGGLRNKRVRRHTWHEGNFCGQKKGQQEGSRMTGDGRAQTQSDTENVIMKSVFGILTLESTHHGIDPDTVALTLLQQRPSIAESHRDSKGRGELTTRPSAVINTTAKATQWGKGSFPSHSSPWSKVRAGSQGQNLEAGTDVETTEEHDWLSIAC